MAVALGAAQTSGTTSVVSSHLVTAPPGITAGNFLLIGIVARDASRTINTPAGWASLEGGTQQNSDLATAVFWKIATGSETDTTVTLSGTAGGVQAFFARFTGVDTSQPFGSAHAANLGTFGNPGAQYTPPITTAGDGTYVVRMAFWPGVASINTPAGHTFRFSENSAAPSGAYTGQLALCTMDALQSAGTALPAVSFDETDLAPYYNHYTLGLIPSGSAVRPGGSFGAVGVTASIEASKTTTDGAAWSGSGISGRAGGSKTVGGGVSAALGVVGLVSGNKIATSGAVRASVGLTARSTRSLGSRTAGVYVGVTGRVAGQKLAAGSVLAAVGGVNVRAQRSASSTASFIIMRSPDNRAAMRSGDLMRLGAPTVVALAPNFIVMRPPGGRAAMRSGDLMRLGSFEYIPTPPPPPIPVKTNALGVARGELMFVQLNRLAPSGAALTGPGDVIVFWGETIEDLSRTVDLDQPAAQEGQTTAPRTHRAKAGYIEMTLGSDHPFDLEVMMRRAGSIVGAGQQLGAGDVRFGPNDGGPARTAFSMIRWHKAYQCDLCVGMWVEVYPKVVIVAAPPGDDFKRLQPLGQQKWRLQYHSNHGFGRGPGNILPGGILSPPSAAYPSPAVASKMSPRIVFIQSTSSDVSPVGLKFPYANAGRISVDIIDDGFQTASFAVGGDANDGSSPGMNGSY